MRKRRAKAAVILCLLVIVVVMCGAVLAYMFQLAESRESELIPAEVSCQVEEGFEKGTVKKEIRVKNTGNIPVYIRLRMVSYWVQEGEITSKASDYPEVELGKDWIEGTNHIFYYTKPVQQGEQTENLLESGSSIILREEDGYQQVVEVFAEAIQYEPEEAVEKSWNVSVEEENIKLK